MDTTSSALARILQLLALHQDVQNKLRAEIMAAREADDIPYDKLIDLPYLDAICRETLRVYVPFRNASERSYSSRPAGTRRFPWAFVSEFNQ